MVRDSDAIPTANPTFSIMPDSAVAMLTLSDVGLLPECKMSAAKPEVEITFERYDIAMRFQRLPQIFDHSLIVCDIADTANVG